MATWPTLDDALSIIGNVDAADDLAVEQCLAGAVEYLTYRCTIVLDDDDVPIVSASLYQACLLLTSRLFKRRQSPEGVAGFGIDGSAVRVSSVDPDIERELLPHRSWGIA